MHNVTKTIINKIKEALKEFGRYTYYDKGADEIMDNDTLLIRELPHAERLTVVKELMAYEHGQNYLASFQGDFEVGDEFMSDAEAEELYAVIEESDTPPPSERTPVKITTKTAMDLFKP